MGNHTITITLSGGPHLAAFSRFWIKEVRGFRPSHHGPRCLIGPYAVPQMNTPTDYRLEHPARALYACGRSGRGDFHAPLAYAPGEQVRLSLTPSSPDAPATFARLERLFAEHRWHFAHTMPENPHFYTRRDEWRRDEDFVWAASQIPRWGRSQSFNRSVWTILEVGAFFYWTGWQTPAWHHWINRKPLPVGQAILAPYEVEQTFIADNARLLDIPALPDGWDGRPPEVTRDEHFRFGVASFGGDWSLA